MAALPAHRHTVYRCHTVSELAGATLSLGVTAPLFFCAAGVVAVAVTLTPTRKHLEYQC